MTACPRLDVFFRRGCSCLHFSNGLTACPRLAAFCLRGGGLHDCPPRRQGDRFLHAPECVFSDRRRNEFSALREIGYFSLFASGKLSFDRIAVRTHVRHPASRRNFPIACSFPHMSRRATMAVLPTFPPLSDILIFFKIYFAHCTDLKNKRRAVISHGTPFHAM